MTSMAALDHGLDALLALRAGRACGPVRRGVGLAALAARHVELAAAGGQRQRRRIPAGGNEAVHDAFAGLGDGNHGDVVVIGVGDVEQFLIAVEGERVGRGAAGGARIERRYDLLGSLERAGIDDDHAVIGGAGHEEAAVAGEQQIVRVAPHRDGGELWRSWRYR